VVVLTAVIQESYLRGRIRPNRAHLPLLTTGVTLRI
jgi:hypothetical protein